MKRMLRMAGAAVLSMAMTPFWAVPLAAQEALPLAEFRFTPHEPPILLARLNERELRIYFTLLHINTEIEKSLVKGFPRLEDKADLSTVLVGGRFPLPPGQAIDYGEDPDAADMGVVGTTGYDFLKGKIVQIDFTSGHIAIFSALPKEAGQEFPIRFFKNAQAHVLFKLGDEAVPFVLTSFPNRPMYLTPRVIDQLKASAFATVEELTETAGTPGRTYRRTFRQGMVKAITCGDLTLRNIPYLEELDEEVSMLSSEFLCQFIVTVDASRNRIFLKPRVPSVELERRMDLGGAGWIRRDGKATVFTLVEGGALERAGIELRDEVIQINEEVTKSMSMMKVRRSFLEPGATVELKVLRDGKPKEIRVTLPKPAEELREGK